MGYSQALSTGKSKHEYGRYEGTERGVVGRVGCAAIDAWPWDVRNIGPPWHVEDAVQGEQSEQHYCDNAIAK